MHSLGKILDDLCIEGGEIVGLAAGDQAVVHMNLLIDPLGPSIAQVGLQARPRGQGATANNIGLDQRPGPVANGTDRLARPKKARMKSTAAASVRS